jgi:hypothetical protein
MILPHAVPRAGGKYNSLKAAAIPPIVARAITAILAFFLGTFTTLYAGLDCSSQLHNHVSDVVIEQTIQQRITQMEAQLEAKHTARIEALQAKLDQCGGETEKRQITSQEDLFPAETTGKFVTSMARVTKEQFVKDFDMGVPVDRSQPGASDVVILYGREDSLPNKYIESGFTEGSPMLEMPEALENCEHLHVLLNDHSGFRKQCLAIVPQYESYYLQNWMRVDEWGTLDGNFPLQMLSRGHKDTGHDEFQLPTMGEKKKHWRMLTHFFNNMDAVKADLYPILKRISVNNTVIVMVCNFGQSELLMNFACSAKSRGHDISPIIVFATDQETADLAESIGLTAYYDRRVSQTAESVQSISFYGLPPLIAVFFSTLRLSATCHQPQQCAMVICGL